MFKRSLEPPATNVGESIQLQQIAYEFRQEVRYRDDFEAYCQWYYDTAEKHRTELAAMKNDIPFFSWFCRSRT
ncbi:hypothetical protein D0962_12990 [Leptolyngbyaceae cyanobacterium CCMR0082]|uniref:Uncharacterized protein n=2 Tax=Adonisia turfae TaxID=2950184 RepID=A0A6M0S5G0_9CYAN|nr:hypothetical protein [Adonisia turfae]MDV3353420.1 hypothetical protein [Leptothoe sp. LEGE 181152]NEZ60595.1 hypothetical protein [Adonisia turfae CCMR0081]NEZ63688.1 hypothetical protein [Adonisia turfae CCMR0082]